MGLREPITAIYISKFSFTADFARSLFTIFGKIIRKLSNKIRETTEVSKSRECPNVFRYHLISTVLMSIWTIIIALNELI